VCAGEDIVVRVTLRDRRTKVHQTEFRWPALDRLGPNDFGGRYAGITLRFGGIRWSFEMAGGRDRVILLVRPLDPEAARDVDIRLETYLRGGAEGRVVTKGSEVLASGRESTWSVSSPSPASRRDGTVLVAPLARPFVAVIRRARSAAGAERRTATAAPPPTPDAPLTAEETALTADVRRAREEWRSRFDRVPHGLWWAYAAIPYGIGWNVILPHGRREPVWVCSRDWCVHGNYGSWVLFNWDQWLIGLLAADFDTELAHAILKPQVEVQQANGMIPGIACELGVSADRAMPPTAAVAVWKAALRTGNVFFAARYRKALERYLDWWLAARDGNGDGLLEWGSDDTPCVHPQWQAHSKWAARYESGMDNHPSGDDAVWNPRACTLEQSDVALNALVAAGDRALSLLNGRLGHYAAAPRLAARGDDLARRLDDRLWDGNARLWRTRRWDGRWVDRDSPGAFYPLFCAGALDPAHIRRAVEGHLRNPLRFGGTYPMPAVPRDDPSYSEQYYWRGRVWGGPALLVHMALREAGLEDDALELAKGALRTFRREWLDKGHLHENYNAETADGEDTFESDPVYSYGIMLPGLMWLQIRDVLMDGTVVETPVEAFREFLDDEGHLAAAVDPVE
jgi:glycogen debranching enzyme